MLSVVMIVIGPGQIFLTQFRSIFCGSGQSGQVSLLWLEFGFKKFPLKTSNFSTFFSSGQKKSLRVRSKSIRVKDRSASHLLRVKSKLRLGQGPSLSYEECTNIISLKFYWKVKWSKS